ncbi:MAG: Alcohol dehydrogenase GroES domain protein [Frankiales bacterium]|nr:Alcohol dehydrogenase GroES domain protein [Frankiales bacterium]
MYDSFGGPLSVREVADPSVPAGGVLVRVEATGVCRSDWHGWQGRDADITSLPHVPGHELAGTVAALGPGVAGWSVGDRVTVPFVNACGACDICREGNGQVCPRQTQPGFTHWGSFAELVALRAADVNLVAVPDGMSMATAASLGCRFATAFRALASVAALQAGERVLVYGGGGVGLSAVQVAVALGATVAVVDPSPAAVELARSMGAVAVVEDPHVTVDAIGDPRVVETALSVLRPRGRHVQVGLLPGRQPTIPMGQVLSQELQILGSHGMAAHDYPAMLSLVTAGQLRPELLVSRTVGLEDAGQALIEVGRTPGITVVEI